MAKLSAKMIVITINDIIHQKYCALFTTTVSMGDMEIRKHPSKLMGCVDYLLSPKTGLMVPHYMYSSACLQVISRDATSTNFSYLFSSPHFGPDG